MDMRRATARTLARTAGLLIKSAGYFSPVYNWWPANNWGVIYESGTGYWQQSTVVDNTTVNQNWAVFACKTLIASDIAKMPASVWMLDPNTKRWTETLQRPVLQRPNNYQTQNEFLKFWNLSLLTDGNAYIFKRRDAKGNVQSLHVLDPDRVTPKVAPNGDVYYTLATDNLAALGDQVTVPASEIIHDKFATLWHPLIGISPITAIGVAAMQSSYIQDNASQFFQNMARPGGIIEFPGKMSKESSDSIKSNWQTNFTSTSYGKVAVLTEGMKYTAMKPISAVDAQLVEQHKFTGEMICAAHHVPLYKLGLGQMPTNQNVSALNQEYFNQCLQDRVTSMEQVLSIGLELPSLFRVRFDTDALLRMDKSTRYDAHAKAVNGGWMTPNEARLAENLPEIAGGDSVYLQQQYYSLEALAKRDAQADPFGKGTPAPALPAKNADVIEGEFEEVLRKQLALPSPAEAA